MYQVKLNIKQIISNVQNLIDYYDNEESLEEIKTSTEHLLSKLENLPLEHFKSRLKKRQRKKRDKISVKQNNDSFNTICKNSIDEAARLLKLATLRELKQKYHQFKSVKECNRFLQNFELLEQLHLLRGHNSTETYKFSLKLRQLKSVWNSLQQDKLQEQTSLDVTVQQKWSQVLFGPLEKMYFRDKPDLADFIRKRNVWDSYINSKYGSSIPMGWVVPHAEVKEQWRPYLVPT